MTIASRIADEVGFDINDLVLERHRIIDGLWVDFAEYSKYPLLSTWAVACSEWREAHSIQNYQNVHDADDVLTGILSELAFGLAICPNSLHLWMPTVAVQFNGDNTFRDFRREWIPRSSFDVEVKCVKPYCRYAPIKRAMAFIGSALAVVIQHDTLDYEIKGIANPKKIMAHTEHWPLEWMEWGFPLDSI